MGMLTLMEKCILFIVLRGVTYEQHTDYYLNSMSMGNAKYITTNSMVKK